MDPATFINDNFDNGAAFIVTGLAVLLVIAVAAFVLPQDPETAVKYDVAIPEQCRPGWKGQQLDEPSLKVRQGLYHPQHS